MAASAEGIGGRIRSWRGDRDLSGDEVAVLLSQRCDRVVTWDELLGYERGLALPDDELLDAIATVFNRSVTELVTGKADVPPLPSSGPAPRAADPSVTAAIAAELRRRGLDTTLAVAFAERGETVGSTKAWLRVFEPTSALAWIKEGFRPAAAERYARQGLGPAEASSPEAHREAGPSGSVDTISAPRASADAIRVWANEGLRSHDAQAWIDAGWDVLAAVPWARAGWLPDEAMPWWRDHWTAADAAQMGRLGIDRETATEWRTTEVPMNDWPAWITLGVDAAAASRWHAAGIGPDHAVGWLSSGLTADDVVSWEAAGFDANSAQRWSDVGAAVDDAVGLVQAGVSPNDLSHWREVGVVAADVAEWVERGFTPGEARRWRGFSAWRAAHLRRNGVSPRRARERQEHGALRLAGVTSQSRRTTGAVHAMGNVDADESPGDALRCYEVLAKLRWAGTGKPASGGKASPVRKRVVYACSEADAKAQVAWAVESGSWMPGYRLAQPDEAEDVLRAKPR